MTPIQEFFKQEMSRRGDLTSKQKQILEASLTLFAEKGFEKTSTADIAAMAGVAEGTVYRHYKTKRELLLAVLAPLMAVMPNMVAEFDENTVRKPITTLQEFVQNLVRDRLEFLDVNYKEVKVLAGELLFNTDLRREFINSLLSKTEVFSDLTKTLDRLKAEGKVVDWPTDLILQFTLSTLIGFVGRQFIELPSELTKDQREKMTVAFLVKGLTP
ncbi:TetR/AcrR family transcriptional regulator [Levilactobacillus bambusae]|uniref:TetR/AcrR family transcriptional regulator n=1 Tax=Levilactobacillus bambusae TaxID=2024736 RepID=A0A2V1MZX1_9LACO|nr:TetR/AcrR family transcriptional regulator [Levilactobacillus bambusae]PWG00539.1 TetR/AcrR family transcriptional regulator [Levilactobacillus bambusae]